jgi:aldose 1-epimerase
VLEDTARIDADSYTPTAAGNIPTGAMDPVKGTAFDFRTMRVIGKDVPQRGYDNNFVLRPHRADKAVAEVDDPKSGRTLKVYTTQPGVQFYVPLYPSPSDRPQSPGTFCLETQHFPDSPNHPQFPSTVLLPGKPFRSTTSYVFGVEGLERK